MAPLRRTLVSAILLTTTGACSSANEPQGNVGGPTTTILIACPDGEHLETDGTGAPRCVVHPPDWTGTDQQVDPDQAAIDLTHDLVTDPQRFADVIVGITPTITEVDDVTFALTNVDLGSAGIAFGVTTSATSENERDDVAWAVIFAISDLWGPVGGFRNETGQVRTGAVLTVDSVRYLASMEMLMQVYDFTISEPDFIAASRQA